MMLVQVILDKPFKDMAADLEKIDPEKFAGAVVILPPDGNPITFLMKDPSRDLMQFWSTVKSRVEVRATEAMQAAANQQDPWGQRR